MFSIFTNICLEQRVPERVRNQNMCSVKSVCFVPRTFSILEQSANNLCGAIEYQCNWICARKQPHLSSSLSKCWLCSADNKRKSTQLLEEHFEDLESDEDEDDDAFQSGASVDSSVDEGNNDDTGFRDKRQKRAHKASSVSRT
jgi:hypothetical protein